MANKPKDKVAAILDDYSDPDESDSKLWEDLATWAFSQDPEIPPSDEITPTEVGRLLDDAATRVRGLKTAASWGSAARYFQAENFHGLEVPAAQRAASLADPPRTTAAVRRKGL